MSSFRSRQPRTATAVVVLLCGLLLTSCGAPTSRQAAPAHGPTVAVIGDSLTYQDGAGITAVTEALTRSGFEASHVYVYGVGGKKLVAPDSQGLSTLQNIAEARSRLGRVDEWLIALGTNDVLSPDAQFTSDVTKVLTAIGGEGHVDWVGVAFYRASNTNAARANPLLEAAVEAVPNGRFDDWNGYIHNGRDETGLWVYPRDSTHMTPAGYAVRNAYYASRASQ